MDLADMDSDSDLWCVTVQTAVCQQAALDVHPTVDGIARRIKGDEEAIAGVVDLAAAVFEEAASQFPAHPGAEFTPSRIADRLHQARRARQVREHQRLPRTSGTRLG